MCYEHFSAAATDFILAKLGELVDYLEDSYDQ
jgi:hypothetical protein